MKTELTILGIVVLLVGVAVGAILLTPGNPSPSSDAMAKLMPQKSVPYVEIKNPSGFVNTDDKPVTIGEYVGKKVILLDVMTYSCINCQRTFPYVTAWYETYKDDGLIVIGIHTPEFAFEKDKGNVEKAMKEFGINFPVVLDNDYATWNALGNRYWPRKYLIDIHGNIVYDHAGEGAYEETEEKIQELLRERAKVLGMTPQADTELATDSVQEITISSRSPETYFGSLRNEYFGNGKRNVSGEQILTTPNSLKTNTLYLGGTWNIQDEFAEAKGQSTVSYRYSAKAVYIVAESTEGGTIEVWEDGVLVDTVSVQESKLYTLRKHDSGEEHELLLKVSDGVRLFAFTFG